MTSFLDREAVEAARHDVSSDTEDSYASDSDANDSDVSEEISIRTPVNKAKAATKRGRKRRRIADASVARESEGETPRGSGPVTTPTSSDVLQGRHRPEQNDTLVKEVRRSNELLLSLVERVKKTEKRLKVVETQLKNPASSSATPSRTKRDVPDEVRVSY